MATNTDLKKFAQSARRQLREQIAVRLEQVLGVDSVEVREKKSAVAQLRQQISNTSKAEVIDKVAYTWFNRFCALRYMDANHYTNVGIVSPAAGNTQPEILQEAKAGFIHEDLKNYVNSKDIFELLSGAKPSANPQQEAYRLLLVAVCNSYYKIMPFMFEEIADYTELLIPLDLLSENSILFQLREVLTEEACQDVEVIGWLYQYYISERKDEVFAALKQNQKIEAKDIPAATQLFTPHWIVRYLVENSLGRLWLLNKPDSKLAEKMEYYIQPVDKETDYLKVANPEELKICDPACGSGHMLTYAFDLLYSIYEEEGYEPASISSLILQKNLFGIEIDGRAGALAAFAVFMKARSKDKRFLSRNIQPNVCVLENVSFTDQELKEYMNAMGRDLFTELLKETLKQFEQVENFGSLIRPVLIDVSSVRQTLEGRNLGNNLFLFGIHERVLKVLRQAECLSPHYQVVVANPPYMGIRGLNDELREFSVYQYPNSKSDLFAMFIERGLDLVLITGYNAMVTMESWMFLSSYESMRLNLINRSTILSMVHMPYLGRGGTSMGISFGTCATIIKNQKNENSKGFYSCIRYFETDEKGVPRSFPVQNERLATASAADFKKIPGAPIAYWASDRVREVFERSKLLGDISSPRQGMATSDNERFVRKWFEVNINKIGFGLKNKNDAHKSKYLWFPYNKGGNYRKWYGNNEDIIRFDESSYKILKSLGNHCPSEKFYFNDAITWTFISSANFGVRLSDSGAVFDVAGSSVFPPNDKKYLILGLMCSKLSIEFMSILNPTLNFQVGNIKTLPIIEDIDLSNLDTIVGNIITRSKKDWNSYETSWDFKQLQILATANMAMIEREQPKEELNCELGIAYHQLRTEWQINLTEMQQLEEENNRIFIQTYGLQDELEPTIPLEEITLTCNPYFRYGGRRNKDELESLLQTDTMCEFISYAVGCMFGRYSLDKPGLILANQGEALQDYLREVPDPTFMPDEDNVIPILDGDWFQDDISERFKKFLKVTFGEEHYEENLQFIEEAIGRDIRSYFLKDFYPYHLKMYKKRPIYWLFSSPKGSFNALIYMHRYNKDTVSIILNNYLREFKSKLEARKSFVEKVSNSTSISPKEKTAAIKELETLKKQLDEITTYESKVLFPLAAKHIEIDLDDGVKANYPKFGEALAPIKGL
jgi:type II restriction/modification system DNA methylase subunit YeeA